MTKDEANEILAEVSLRNIEKDIQYRTGWYCKGTINAAIRTVFNRKSSTKDEMSRATMVQDKVIRATWYPQL